MTTMAGKRKRESLDQGGPVAPPSAPDFRASPHNDLGFDQYVNSHHESDMPPHFADALVQHNAGEHNMHNPDHNGGQNATDTANAALHYSMSVNVPQAEDNSFLQESAADPQHHREQSASLGFEPTNHQQQPNPYELSAFDAMKEPSQQPDAQQQQQQQQQQQMGPQQQQQQQQLTPTPTGPEQSPPLGGLSGSKPAVGTSEWHKVRKDNHKEVERRRRETINEGINEIAKIVPGCEKNKGSILQRAVQFIQQLKENESQNIEKWTLEKLLTEQAIAELSATCDKLKEQHNQTYAELQAWKKCAERAGLQPTEDDRAAAHAAARDGEE
ncbi:hypothetical protein AAFC00_005169 [Neodothiora populina]